MKKVLVAGATGYLGSYVVKEFKKKGYWVRALTRNKLKSHELVKLVDDIHVGEVTLAPSLEGLCKDIDIVFSSVGITRQKDNLTYYDVDYLGNKNILEEAQKNNVEKFIYISSLGAERMPNVKVTAAKQLFVKALVNSGLNFTVFYPNGFFSDMLEILKMAQNGHGYIFGSGEYKLNPIHGADLAEACVDSVDLNVQEIEIGGPDIFTHKQVFEVACQALDKEPKITSIPIWIRDVVLWILRTFTSQKTYGPYEFFLTAMTMDMVAPKYGKRHLLDFYRSLNSN